PRDLLAVELRSLRGRSLTEAEVDAAYTEHLLQVELVQLEHLAILRCLAKHHGLRRVFAEGLTAQESAAYRDKITDLKDAEADLRKQREEMGTIRKDARPGSQQQTKAKEAWGEILAALGQHRLDVRRLGVAGQLLLSGEIENVFPLADADLLERAKP